MTRLQDAQKELDRLLLEIDSPYVGMVKITNWQHTPESTRDTFVFTASVTIVQKHEGGMRADFKVSESWARDELERMLELSRMSGQDLGPGSSLAMRICDQIYQSLEGKSFGDAQREAAKAGLVKHHLQRLIERRKSEAKWK